MLSTTRLALHWALSQNLIRALIRRGVLIAEKGGREWRIAWPAIWTCETGPTPPEDAEQRYQVPLATRFDLAAARGVDVRTVDRWLVAGLPTRNVGANVRINAHEAAAWLSVYLGRPIDPSSLIPKRSKAGVVIAPVADIGLRRARTHLAQNPGGRSTTRAGDH